MKVYRFRDAAALGGKYMTAHDARKIAAGLMAVADSIEREGFGASPSLSVEVDAFPDLFELDKEKGKLAHVNFRVWGEDEGGDVIALFVDNPSDPTACSKIDSYQHIGQHGGASAELFNDLAQAHPEDSTALKRELEGLGYVLREFEYIASDENQPEQKPDDMPPYAGMPGGI